MSSGCESLAKTAAPADPAFIIGAAGRGVATDNFNFLVIGERKWSPDLARRRKIQHWAELEANKILQAPSCEYSTLFRSNRRFLPGFLSQIRALGGEIAPPQKKFRSISRKSY